MTSGTKSDGGDPIKLLERQLYTGPIQPGCEPDNLKGVNNAP